MGISALAQLVRKTGFIYRRLDLANVKKLFAELEEYDQDERMETFVYLRQTLDATRRSVSSEPSSLKQHTKKR